MRSRAKQIVLYDRVLLWATLGLIAFGLLEVTSSSMVIAERQFGNAFHYIEHQLVYLLIGFLAAFIVLRCKIKYWQQLGFILLIMSFLLLIAVLIPGIGRAVNGSRRWIALGPITMQVSELAKFSIVIFLSGYLVRREDETQCRP